MITPKFVPIVSVTGLASLVLCAFLAWWVQSAADAEAQRDCERSVGYRNDSRAMWTYLVDTSTGGDQARIDAFVVELNKRLPVLTCRDGNLVPVAP